MKKICFIYTEYQKNVFTAIALQENLDLREFLFVYNKNIIPMSNTKNYFVKSDFKGFNYKFALDLKREILNLIAAETNGEDYEVWLASDDHPVGQILINYQRNANVIMFEDGLGSYINYKPFFFISLFSTLAFLRNVIYFIPFYRSIRPGGGYRRPAAAYAFFEQAFPALKNVKKINSNYFKSIFIDKISDSDRPKVNIFDNSLIFLEQSHVEGRLMTAITYRRYALKLIEKICEINKLSNVYIRPHPASNMELIFENMRYYNKNSKLKFILLDLVNTFEEMILAASSYKFCVASFNSTSMYITKLIRPDIESYCLNNDWFLDVGPSHRDCYDVLTALGVLPIEIDW